MNEPHLLTFSHELSTVKPVWAKNLNYLISPDDGSPLTLVQEGDTQALYSESSGYLHPVIDDIPVLLGEVDRSHVLEYDAVAKFSRSDAQDLRQAAAKTLEILRQREAEGGKSFAWEDEETWDREYSKEVYRQLNDCRWNDRLWQRTPMVNHAFSGPRGNPQVILDVGCGEGYNFRSLLKDRMSQESLYIGADISIAGIRRHRFHSTFLENTVYILCSADRLPIQKS